MPHRVTTVEPVIERPMPLLPNTIEMVFRIAPGRGAATT